MRLLIIDHYYDRFLDDFYRRHPETARMSYQEHLACLMKERFSTSDAYSHYFRQNGWEAGDVIANSGRLQTQWARENGVRVFRLPNIAANAVNVLFARDWRFKVLLAQAAKAKPDVILIQEQSILTDDVTAELKKISRLVICQIASPLVKRRSYRSIDFALTCAPAIAKLLREKGLEVELLNLGFDKRVLAEIGMLERKIAISFVGGVSRHHKERIVLLEALSRELPLEWFGYGENILPASSPLRKAWRGNVWGLELYRILSSSWMTFNSHIDIAGEYANNMRLFEATGTGTCLLTDWKKNIGEFFEADKEIVTYRSAGELVEKARSLLSRREECRKIGEAGQDRTLRFHGYDERIRELCGILKRYL